MSIQGSGRCAGSWPNASAQDVCVDSEGGSTDEEAKTSWGGAWGGVRTEAPGRLGVGISRL